MGGLLKTLPGSAPAEEPGRGWKGVMVGSGKGMSLRPCEGRQPDVEACP